MNGWDLGFGALCAWLAEMRMGSISPSRATHNFYRYLMLIFFNFCSVQDPPWLHKTRSNVIEKMASVDF